MPIILIADDIAENRYLLESMLKGFGYKVTSVANGAEALKRARKNPPDLIITDILMPVMDGWELCRQWKAHDRLKQIPFVFYTATYTDPKDEQFAYSLGADRFIVKPQKPEKLEQVVREVIEEYGGKPGIASPMKPLGEEMEVLRQYNEVLFRKLEKKMTDLQAEIAERKRTEEALRESETRFRTIFESIPDCVIVHDDKGTILHINEIGAQQLEWPAKDLIGRNLREIVTPEQRALIAAHIRETHKAGSCRFETTYVSRSGWQIIAEIHDHPIRFGEVKAILRVSRDITERKEAERALLKEKTFSDAVINSSPGLLFVFGEKGNIIQWNSSAENITGYSTSEIAKMNILAFVAKEDTKAAAEAIQKALSEGRASVEINVQSKSGKKSPFFIIGLRSKIENTDCVVCSGIDIAELKRTEEALRTSEDKYRTILENIEEGYYEVDLAGNFTFFNNATCRILGYPKEELIGMNNRQYTGKENAKRIFQAFNKVYRTGKFSKGYDYEIIKKDGTRSYVETSILLRNDSSDKAVGFRGIIRDITERKQAEEALQHSYAQLRESLISTVDALASTVEIRDQYTAGHQQRATGLACAIADEMGLSEDQIEGVRMACAIHDIGKIMVPAEILNKPGPITELQFDIIKTHPQAGYDILKGIEFPWPVAEIVLQHHERMDGSGYPHGVKGKEIMLEARILAVADVVEAMSSHRPYRPSLGIDKALEEISQNRGVLYDADAVDTCIRLFTEKGFMFREGT